MKQASIRASGLMSASICVGMKFAMYYITKMNFDVYQLFAEKWVFILTGHQRLGMRSKFWNVLRQGDNEKIILTISYVYINFVRRTSVWRFINQSIWNFRTLWGSTRTWICTWFISVEIGSVVLKIYPGFKESVALAKKEIFLQSFEEETLMKHIKQADCEFKAGTLS